MPLKNWLFVVVCGLVMLPRSTYSQSPDQPIVLLNDGDIWTYSDSWRQLTDFGFYRSLALAPDGSQIAFAGLTQAFAESVSSGQMVGDSLPSTEIWIMSLSDGDMQRIASQDDYEGNVVHSTPTFAPDNSALAWTELEGSLGYYLAVYDRASGTISRHPINFPALLTGYPSPPPIQFGADGQIALIWYGQDAAESGQFLAEFDLGGNAITSPLFLGEMLYVSDFVPLQAGAWAVLTDSKRWILADAANGSRDQLSRPPAFGMVAPLYLLSFYTDHTEMGADWIVLTENGLQDLPYHEFDPDKISLSPDGSQLVYPNDQGLVIWQNGAETAIPFPGEFLPQTVIWSSPAWFHDVDGIPEFQ